MKVMKVCLLLAAFVAMTGVASAQAIWWDNDSTDGLWVTGLNWNEGEFVDVLVPAVPGYMDNGPDGLPGTADDFWVDPVPEYTIPGYGNDIGPVLGQSVDLRNIAVTTTNVGEAGPIGIGINTGHVAESGNLFIGRSSATSDAVAVTVNGGSLETDGWIRMGEVDGDVAALNLLDGSITIGSSDHLIVGHGLDDPTLGGKESDPTSGGVATFDMAAGTTLTISQDLEVTYFAGTTGTFTAVGDGDSGTIDIVIGDDFRVAGNDHNNDASTGVMTITNIAMEVGDIIDIGRYGNGTLTATNSSIDLINGGNDVKIGAGGSAPDGSTGGTGTVILNSSSLNATDDFQVGSGGTGTFTMTGSSSMDVDDRMELATGGGIATVTVGGTSTLNVGTGDNDNRRLYLGDNGGTATLTLNDDSVTWVYDDIPVGDDGSTGYLNINDNATLTSDRDDLELGYSGGGLGIMTMTGGTVNIGDDFEMSKSNPGDSGTSVLTMSGGIININDDMKMGQCGGSATVVMTGGLINVGDSLRVTHFDSSKDMSGTVGHLTLGDRDDEEIAFGAARINAAGLYMPDSPVDQPIDNWIDFLPGGLLLIDDDVTAMIETLIADGLLLTTYTGDYFGLLGEGEFVGIVNEYDNIALGAEQTAVYLGVIPEPATMLLLGFGGLLLRRKRRVS